MLSYSPFRDGFLSSMMLRMYMFVDNRSIPPTTWQIILHMGQVILATATAAWTGPIIAWFGMRESTINNYSLSESFSANTVKHFEQKVWWQPMNFGLCSPSSNSSKQMLHWHKSWLCSSTESLLLLAITHNKKTRLQIIIQVFGPLILKFIFNLPVLKNERTEKKCWAWKIRQTFFDNQCLAITTTFMESDRSSSAVSAMSLSAAKRITIMSYYYYETLNIKY